MSCNHALSQINSRPRKLRELKLCKLGKSDIGDFIPIDQRTKKPLPLPEWTLRPYIDVAHEICWITRSGKDVAAVLRDYRNYVHPEKQRSHGSSSRITTRRCYRMSHANSLFSS